MPARSFRTTFSHIAAFSPTWARSSASNIRPAVFNFWLWQLTQY